MRFALLILLFIVGISASAQRESQHWYFGKNAGIEFTDLGVIADTLGKTNTIEGCASISDSNGLLQFYTDGISIWNRNHEVMESGLNGNQSSTQSAVIVNNPADKSKYFVFTTAGRVDGMQYTEVDMSLNGGLGGVTPTIKNRSLLKNTLEKITAVKHANQKEYWVIGHKIDGSSFNVYLVTINGEVESKAVINIGNTIDDGIGYMKISPNGRRLAMANSFSGTIDLFSFNAKTGSIENHVNLDSLKPLTPYGLEFSPDGNLLYVSSIQSLNDSSYLLQYNLNSQDEAVVIGAYKGDFGALQLGPDGSIYLAQRNHNYLAAIKKPNTIGQACEFDPAAVYLNTGVCRLGLPTFIQSYFIDAEFVYDGECVFQETSFHSLSQNADSVHWDFGDPSSGENNYSTLVDPKHSYTAVGTYLVRITIYVTGESESYSEEIEIKASPILNLRDSIICNTDSYTVNIPYPEAVVAWDDGNSEHSRTIDVDGKYTVEVNLNGCSVEENISLAFYDIPMEEYEFIKACMDERLLLEVHTEKSNYIWNDGVKERHNYVFTDGIYIAEVENPCGIDTASFEVIFNDCECTAFVPNAISLNGDGLNDAFKATLSCELDLEYYLLKVYSLWGEKVFEAHHRDEGFIPTDYQSDVFIWTLEFGSSEYSNNVSKTYSGVVHVLR